MKLGDNWGDADFAFTGNSCWWCANNGESLIAISAAHTALRAPHSMRTHACVSTSYKHTWHVYWGRNSDVSCGFINQSTLLFAISLGLLSDFYGHHFSLLEHSCVLFYLLSHFTLCKWLLFVAYLIKLMQIHVLEFLMFTCFLAKFCCELVVASAER